MDDWEKFNETTLPEKEEVYRNLNMEEITDKDNKLEYQNIINLLDDTSNQPPKFRTKSWVEINDQSRGTYKANNQIRIKTSMLRTSLYDYSDAYIPVKGTMTVANTAVADADANNTNKNVMLKNCAPFTSCISTINNIQIDDVQYIDVVMPMYNLIEYSDNYSKKCLEFYFNIAEMNQLKILIIIILNLFILLMLILLIRLILK